MGKYAILIIALIINRCEWWQNVPKPYVKVTPTPAQQERIRWALSYHGNYTIVTTPTELYMDTDKGRVRL